MLKSSFGKKLKITIWGGSHEPSVGVDIKGFPAGFEIDMDRLEEFLQRRAPGNSPFTSSRKEPDVPIALTSNVPVTDGRTIRFEIRNTDHRSSDYDRYKAVPRPGHADYTGCLRYGMVEAGGGAFSGRMTAPLCIAGGIAIQYLESLGIEIGGRIESVGGIANSNCCDGQHFNGEIAKAIMRASEEGDSLGGVISCTATGVPAGLGGAMYDGLEGTLSDILFGIPAVKGVEFGAGFRSAAMKGSENNDPFYFDGPKENGVIKTRTNNCGGILGGITNGMPVTLNVAFKPTPSIEKPQESVNISTGESETVSVTGRHDPCVALRAVPAVESAVALGILDRILCHENPADSSGDNLQILRGEIDRIDDEMLALFSERMNVVKDISSYKKANRIPVLNPRRESEVLAKISAGCSSEFKPYARQLFTGLMAMSRDLQNADMPSGFGLIGHPLGHSFSREVHEAIGLYNYDLLDLEPDEMKALIRTGRFTGLNITIPYKRDVICLCDDVTGTASKIGAVNTIFKSGEGRIIGHNTDYEGFLYTAAEAGIDFSGKTVMVIGSGGTSHTVRTAAEDRGAAEILISSRKGPVLSDEEKSRVQIIVNATPVGMYPHNGDCPVCLDDYPACEAVIDVIYNPLMTPLMLQARSRNLKFAGGLPMLVCQATAAAGYFMGTPGAFAQKNGEILSLLKNRLGNIVFIGMPGCGKTTAGRKLARLTGRKFVDLDAEIASREGMSAGEIIREKGEDYFRRAESELAAEYGKEHGLVIATGGGTVLRDENYVHLKQNGTIIWLTRPLDKLATADRPLSAGGTALEEMYRLREPLYEKWADMKIDSETYMATL